MAATRRIPANPRYSGKWHLTRQQHSTRASRDKENPDQMGRPRRLNQTQTALGQWKT